MLNPNFVFLGVGLQLVGGFDYLVKTIKGEIKPNKVTWFLWALAPLIAFFAEIQKGVGIQSLMTFSVGFVPLLVFAATFINKKSKWKLGKFDLICGGLSILGLLLWMLTQEGNLAILFSLIADGLAAAPTVVKSFKYPETESPWVYLLGTINAFSTLLTINIWNFAHWGFPLYIFMIDAVLSVLIIFKVGKNFKFA